MPKRLELIKAREDRQETQKDVADAVEITESYYGMIEQGVRTPRFPIMLKIAQHFGRPIEELFGGPNFFTHKSNEVLDDDHAATKEVG